MDRFLCAPALAVLLVTSQAVAAPSQATFVKSASIAAPDDRWDFTSWDAAHHLLLVAHGKDVLLIDPAHPDKVRSIGAIQGGHGVEAVPGGGTLVVSSGKDNTLRVLDIASGAELASIPVAEDPDALVLSADHRLVYVMAAKGGAISVVDLALRKEVSRIALKPGLEVPVLVGKNLIAVNNEDESEIELANLATGKSAGRIALRGCEGPTGLALDPASGLALSSCANGKAALVDLRKLRLVSLVNIGAGPDTVIWDRAHKRFLVPCGKDGTLSVVRLVGRKMVIDVPTQTEASARTAAMDPASGRVYLPSARFAAPVAPSKRGVMEPGSFHVLVLSPVS